jgi:two-component system, cell cycle sensor histidine kinase and response regulator CckA
MRRPTTDTDDLVQENAILRRRVAALEKAARGASGNGALERVEHALEASEARYRRSFEAAKDGILILRADSGEIIDVNPFLLELTGHASSHFLGKALWEIGLFEGSEACRACFQELMTNKYVRYDDLPLRASDERTIDVELVSYVYAVEDQNVIQCNIRDITESKRAENRILESRATLNAILESSTSRTYALDRGYRYIAFNQAHAAAMKALYGQDILLGKDLDECRIPPGDWQTDRKLLDRALSGETLSESASVGAEASRGFFEVTYNPMHTHGGEIIGVSVSTRDVTARKLAEDELRFRNLILSTQQEASIDGILIVDVDGNVVSANRLFADMWGTTLDALESGCNGPALDAVMDRLTDPEEFRAKLEQLASTPDERIQDEIALNDGSTFDRYSAPMRGPDGKHFGRLWQFRDITKRKRVEEERKKLEERLRASEKMDGIGSLAGGVAHDFNNLLSVILSYTGFALEEVSEGDPLKEDLLEVKKAAERAVALTRQLLAFGRKQVLRPVPLDLNEVASGIEQMFRRILGEDIDFVQTLTPHLGVVRADPGQIEQVLMNLVINARDAMPDGGKLTIDTSNVELDDAESVGPMSIPPGAYVQLAVTDTGCGMDEAMQSRLFEPFFTTKEEGTGLGLATVYGIVKQSGGGIRTYSEPGHGTTFEICLPRELSVDAQEAPMAGTVSPVTGTETILVVEDEDSLRKVAKRTLDAAGFTVLTAADGDEALRVFATHVGEIHLLLTDVIMPRMSGKALVQELEQKHPRLKVLYMSGYTDSAIVHHGVLEAGTNFLAKPFTAAELARKVHEVLANEPLVDAYS